MTIAQCEGRMRNASGKAGKMVKGARAMRPRKKREAKVRKGTYLVGANCKAARTHAKHTRHILHVKKGRGVEGNVFDSGQLHGHNRQDAWPQVLAIAGLHVLCRMAVSCGITQAHAVTSVHAPVAVQQHA